MLMINGRKFAKNDREFIGSLFEAGRTCFGYYKKKPGRAVVLYDMQRKPIAWIKREAPGYAFAGTAHDCGGRVRYMLGLASYTAGALGLSELTTLHDREALSHALESIGV